MLLTHAHLDHTGRLPLLARAGFAGPIFATPATIEMTGLILRDAAKIQMQDAERTNRKQMRADEPPVHPLYTVEDVERILRQLKPVPYHDPVAVAPGIRARFVEAGHMLGSASLQLLVDQDGQQRTVAFSGDLGPKGAPILRDSEPFPRRTWSFSSPRMATAITSRSATPSTSSSKSCSMRLRKEARCWCRRLRWAAHRC